MWALPDRAWRPFPAVVAAALLVAGCGTTANLRSLGPDSGGFESPGPSTAGGGAAGTNIDGSSGTGAVSSASGAASSAGGPSGAVVGSAGPQSPTSAATGGLPGVVDAPGSSNSPARGNLPPIEIGTYYLNGGGAALAAEGFDNLVIPDNKPVFAAFVNYVNAHGGLGGRKIEPVYYEYEEGANPQTQDQAACQTFTQDNHVYLVFGGISSGAGDLMPCLAQHGIPLIGSGIGGDASYFATYHRFDYEPDQMNYTTALTLLVQDLQQRGFLNGVHSVGLIQYPGSTYDAAVNDGLIPALSAVGLKLNERYTTSSSTDNSSIATSAENAVLKFKTENIGLVLFMTPGGAAETYFMTEADTEGYKPKYGIWSADSPYVLADTAPKDQLAGSIGIGYEPGLDVASDADPTAETAAGKACLAFGTSLGLSESGLANPLVRAACDDWYPLLRVVSADPQVLTSTATLEQGFNALGSSYASASTFAMDFTPGRHDEAHGYRQLAFEASCSCFEYLGPTHSTK